MAEQPDGEDGGAAGGGVDLMSHDESPVSERKDIDMPMIRLRTSRTKAYPSDLSIMSDN
jgi:hypothetical protein